MKDLVQALPEEIRPGGTVDAGDMDEVDRVIDVIKRASSKGSS